jgi:hypothetical protein
VSDHLPIWVGEDGFITGAEWARFDEATRAEWLKFAGDVNWLMEQPQFRRVAFTLLNDHRFFSTDRSPVRESVEGTYHAIGVQHAGRMLRLVLQAVSPRMWMKMLHDAFNVVANAKVPPPTGGAKE